MSKNRSENNEWSLERAESSWTLQPFSDFSSAKGALTDPNDGIECPEDQTGEENFKSFFFLV